MPVPVYNNKNNIVVDGIAGPLHINDGYGSGRITPVDEEGPGATITDVVSRNLALFITEFRQTREV